MKKVSMSSPDLNDADRQAVMDVLNTPILSIGERILKFEELFCKFTGFKHAIGVNSGTSGLHLCVRAADIGPGDMVITTPFSFISSTNVFLFEKAIPIFVDVDPKTGNIDPVALEAAVDDIMRGTQSQEKWLPRHLPDRGWEARGHLKAILPVDVFGQPADYDAILPVARRYGLKVIEDSCEALGATYKYRPAGTLGDYGVFAFYPNKQITTGEGGMIVTDDGHAAELMRSLRNQGRAPGDTWLQHSLLGYNYRMDEMSAALGITQMERLESLLVARQRVADWYATHLANIHEVQPPVLVPETTRVSWFVYVIRVNEKINRDALAKLLMEKDVPVRPYFAPIHLQPFMQKMFGYEAGDFPVTEALGNSSLAIPFSGVMTEEQVVFVCQAISETVTNSVVWN